MDGALPLELLCEIFAYLPCGRIGLLHKRKPQRTKQRVPHGNWYCAMLVSRAFLAAGRYVLNPHATLPARYWRALIRCDTRCDSATYTGVLSVPEIFTALCRVKPVARYSAWYVERRRVHFDALLQFRTFQHGDILLYTVQYGSGDALLWALQEYFVAHTGAALTRDLNAALCAAMHKRAYHETRLLLEWRGGDARLDPCALLDPRLRTRTVGLAHTYCMPLLLAVSLHDTRLLELVLGALPASLEPHQRAALRAALEHLSRAACHLDSQPWKRDQSITMRCLLQTRL